MTGYLPAAIGALVWLVSFWFCFPDSDVTSLFARVLLWAPLVIVPLVLVIVRTPDRAGREDLPWRIARWLQPVAAILVVVSLCIDSGNLAGLLVLPWLSVTIFCACFGLWRLLPRGPFPIEELCIDAGLIYLPIGAAWLVASRTGLHPFHFGEPIVFLTAVHFHYAGLAAPVLAGLIGRVITRRPGLLRAYRVAAIAVLFGPALLALGITISPLVEIISAFVLAVGVLVLSGVWVLGTFCKVGGVSRLLLVVAAAALPTSMALAATYAVGEWLGRTIVTFPTMGIFHGVANAFGFATCGLIAFALLKPKPVYSAGAPMSRLRSSGLFIGRDWFSRNGRVGEGTVRGMLDRIEDLTGQETPLRVHPAIRAFYEQTAEHRLFVRAKWHSGFRFIGKIYVAIARRMGQLVLPVEGSDLEEVTCSLASLVDGDLPGARVYVRTYRQGDRPMYVAAYAVHRHQGVGYMNIALPLPGGNMTSIIKMEVPGSGEGLVLTSDGGGDTGIWYANRICPVRLPLSERLEMWAADARNIPPSLADAPAGTTSVAVAKHRLFFCGIPFLTMDYFICPAEREQ